MTFIGFFGILLGLLAIPIVLRGSTFKELGIAFALVMIHVAASFYYYQYTQTNPADAWAYYYTESLWTAGRWGTSLGTAFVGTATLFLKHRGGATYLDCFMFFQAFGTWGILLMMKLFREIAAKAQVAEAPVATYMLFIPSLHFWTSAIGKDAPIFFAVALCTWSVMNMSKRWVSLILSIGTMVLFRAHIALAAGISLSLALVAYRHFSFGKKAVLIVVAMVGLGYLLSAVQATFSVDLTDANSVSHFMEVKNAADLTDNARSSIATAAYPLRLFALLFRPFFIDAHNVMGLIASVENIGSVLLFFYFAWNFRRIWAVSRDVLFIRFALIFSLVLIVILAQLNYNIGLGLRQRVMAMPPLLSAFVAAYAVLKRKAALAAQTVRGGSPLTAMPVNLLRARSSPRM